MIPPVVLHGAPQSAGLAGWLPLALAAAVGLSVVGAAVVLFRGRLGESDAKRFLTLGALILAGVAALVAVDRLLVA